MDLVGKRIPYRASHSEHPVEVEVIEQDQDGVKIRFATGREQWTDARNLVLPKTAPIVRKTKEAKPRKKPVLLPRTGGNLADLIAYCEETTYYLVACCKPEGIDRAKAEYRAWSGEALDSEFIRVQSASFFSDREWHFRYNYDAHAPTPFPLVEGRTGGGRALGEPAGIVQNGYVTVYSPALVEQVVRAGLRASTR